MHVSYTKMPDLSFTIRILEGGLVRIGGSNGWKSIHVYIYTSTFTCLNLRHFFQIELKFVISSYFNVLFQILKPKLKHSQIAFS